MRTIVAKERSILLALAELDHQENFVFFSSNVHLDHR